MKSRNHSWIFFVIGILWITGVMLTFYEWAPKGHGGVQWDEVGGIIGLVMKHVVRHYLIVIVIVFSSWVAGSRMSAALKLEFTGALEEVVISTALGIVLHSMAVMFLGFLHLLYVPVLLLQVIAPIIVWRKTFGDTGKRVLEAWRNAKITGVQLILLIVLIICVLFTSLNPLYPPTSLDAVNAYLTMPKSYLDAGWFILDPYIKYSMTPNNHTLLFTLAMSFGTGITAVLTHWAMWVLLLAALVAFGSRYLTPTGGLCAAIAFALIPVTTVTATWGNSENFTALFALMGFWGMWRFMQSRSTGDAILAGIFLGFALGVKLFTGMLWVGIILYAAIYLCSIAPKFSIKRFLLIVLISVAMLCPWLVRNAVYFGNPFFPYFNDNFAAFGGIFEEYETDLAADMKSGLKSFSTEANDITLMNFAGEMTFWPNWGSKPGEPQQKRFTERAFLGIGPLFIVLLPLLVFVRRRWKVLSMMLVISAFCILVWLFGLKVVYIRYWSFFFPFLMLAGGFAFAETFQLDKQTSRRPFGLLFISVLSALVLLLFINGVMPKPGGGSLPLKEANRHALLVREVAGFRLIEALNSMEPEPRVYYLYGATARYYCDFFVIAGYTSPHNYDRFWEHASDGADLAEWLNQIGITHLMVNEKTLRAFGKKLPSDAGFAANFTLVKRDTDAVLYELRPLQK